MMIAKRQCWGLALVAALTALPILACSSSSSSGASNTFVCGAASKCPNDAPQPAEATTECQQALAGPCAAEYQAYGNCVVTNEKCGSDGKIDNASIQSCSAQIGPLTTCEQANADAGTD